MGQQIGNIAGRDLIFFQKSYFKKEIRTENNYYKEALLALGSLQIKKGIRTLHDWDKQHIFYNPLFKTENGKTLKLTEYCKVNNIYNYEQLVEEKRKQLDNIPFDENLTCILDKILVDTSLRKENILLNEKGKK